MPLGVKPECVKCGSKETPLWHTTAVGNLEKLVKPARKSTRVTRYNGKVNKTLSQPHNVKNILKGKGRRHIFKKMPIKSPLATATPVTTSYVFYKGSYFQIGDIVSMQDIDGGIYYAQIRGLLTDQYCEKSAAITWLLPTATSPPPEDGFSPETYIIGPEEDLPRKLEYMEFVMHAPSDYYKLKNSPYPPILTEGGTGYIWTSLRNETNVKK
ncbi:PREDICTED: GATA zinc finger domain-containing protein 1 isoform X2 [Ceratosolen solmsi marchali]|uniref:GATA zinc finger domain-containing protein 1 isoform X2 n=1 Tax=Ceratosolen solmsi marchali TaxID=326594 RepID=A0AAJ7DUN7_9HYME|nr:PREDICTED: GATA zinc finger domain-containing protein 1 isoform X2 [Ceratosolen solmsi marchali]